MWTDADQAGRLAMRQRCMAALARADAAFLDARWAALGEPPGYRLLRGPEVGLVMVRGRAGGSGEPFNLGEMTVTRCSVQLDDGRIGHAYVAGRKPRQAEIAALADALLQDPAGRADLLAELIEPLEAAEDARRRRTSAKTAATRVEFFTVAHEGGQ
jgi:alpha-D-ribose 1-methylphosphonate 5-triphosphate synthase subunit PhnG